MSKALSATAILRLFCGSIFVTALAFCAVSAGQQPRHLISTSGFFNREAEASDAAGIGEYSHDLASLIVPEQAGPDYINSFADRLAKAEQEAREGKRKLISEADVVRAFNEMMKRSGASPSVTANAGALRRFRAHGAAIGAFPALLSADRNGTNCNPGEAVYLIWLLRRDNGVLSERYLDYEIYLETLVERPRPQDPVIAPSPIDPGIVRHPENPADPGIARSAENPEIPGVISSQEVQALGLTGRNFSQLVTIQPGGKSEKSWVRRQRRLARRQRHSAIKQSNAVAKTLSF
jgi:hypothetical protein